MISINFAIYRVRNPDWFIWTIIKIGVLVILLSLATVALANKYQDDFTEEDINQFVEVVVPYLQEQWITDKSDGDFKIHQTITAFSLVAIVPDKFQIGLSYWMVEVYYSIEITFQDVGERGRIVQGIAVFMQDGLPVDIKEVSGKILHIEEFQAL